MKKRVLWIVLVVLLVVGLSVSVFAVQKDLSVIIDNQQVQFTADSGKPFVDENGRTQVPLRVVMEQYGCRVEWDNDTRTAVLTKDGMTVTVPVGEKYITVDGRTVYMDTSALLREGRIYLPIRCVLEAFGADVYWDNGEIAVFSPTSGDFENIYVDRNGDVFFELANGNKVNVGSLPRGKDGRDGVSVTNAYVDGNGNLMIELSNGRTINAGNVSVGGNMNGLTFADYPIGTKFYLAQPTGAFDVTVKMGDNSYVVEFNGIYCELTEKHDVGDADGWAYDTSVKDYGLYPNGSETVTTGITTFVPFVIKVHIKGKTNAQLAGATISVRLTDDENGIWTYRGNIQENGSFDICVSQGEGQTMSWYTPRNLYFRDVSISKSIITTSPPSRPTVTQIVEKFVGRYQLITNPDKVLVLEADGKLTIDGAECEANYTLDANGDRLTAVFNGGRAQFYLSSRCVDVAFYDIDEITTYHKEGTWEAITLTKDNFLDYYDYEELFRIAYDAFGDFHAAMISHQFILKEEHASKRLRIDSIVPTVKVKENWCWAEYTIDFENETYILDEPDIWNNRTEVVSESGINRGFYLGTTSLDRNMTESVFYEYELIDVVGTLYFTK